MQLKSYCKLNGMSYNYSTGCYSFLEEKKMDYKIRKTLFPLVSFVALVALACTCGNIGAADPTPTAVPIPTNPPPATKPPVELPTEPPATKPPIGGGDDGGNGTIIDEG